MIFFPYFIQFKMSKVNICLTSKDTSALVLSKYQSKRSIIINNTKLYNFDLPCRSFVCMGCLSVYVECIYCRLRYCYKFNNENSPDYTIPSGLLEVDFVNNTSIINIFRKKFTWTELYKILSNTKSYKDIRCFCRWIT